MYLSNFNSCCGAKILSGFGRHVPENVYHLNKYIPLDQYFECILPNKTRGHQMTVVACLNGGQNRVWGRVLSRHGFKKVGETKNPNTGHIIHTYIHAYRGKRQPDV